MQTTRILGALAYYLQALAWDVILLCCSELLSLAGSLVAALAPIILFAALFVVLELLKLWPDARARLVAFSAPGNAVLGEWLSLMFFALCVGLPPSLASVAPVAIVGWLGACVLGASVNLAFSAYLAAGASWAAAAWGRRCSCTRAASSDEAASRPSKRMDDADEAVPELDFGGQWLQPVPGLQREFPVAQASPNTSRRRVTSVEQPYPSLPSTPRGPLEIGAPSAAAMRPPPKLSIGSLHFLRNPTHSTAQQGPGWSVVSSVSGLGGLSGKLLTPHGATREPSASLPFVGGAGSLAGNQGAGAGSGAADAAGRREERERAESAAALDAFFPTGLVRASTAAASSREIREHAQRKRRHHHHVELLYDELQQKGATPLAVDLATVLRAQYADLLSPAQADTCRRCVEAALHNEEGRRRRTSLAAPGTGSARSRRRSSQAACAPGSGKMALPTIFAGSCDELGDESSASDADPASPSAKLYELAEPAEAAEATQLLVDPLPTPNEVLLLWCVAAAAAATLRLFAPLLEGDHEARLLAALEAGSGADGGGDVRALLREARDGGGLSQACLFVFQLAACMAVHLVATKKHAKIFGGLPSGVRLLLQPAMLSAAGMMLVAGGTSSCGFLDGLRRFVMREPSALGLFEPGALAHWGPGKLITVHLSPAIAVLAFPTSHKMAEVRPTLHVLVPTVAAAALFSLYSMALIGRLLLPGAPSVALSTLPHSVSTAVAVGYVDLLCHEADEARVCATTSVIATTCIVTGTLVMVCGRGALDLLRVTSPFARGAAAGSSGMALGVAALRAGGEEAATGVAACSYALFAVVSSVLMLIQALAEHASAVAHGG